MIWRLGGKRSDFAMGPGTTFAWQHSQSRTLVLALDHTRMRATLERRFVHRPPVLAFALGSMQALPNGNWLVGWGTEPYITEYRPDGTVAFDLKLPEGGQNYRAFRLPWSGTPSETPMLAARRTASGHALYASWNGATEVASWRLETGPSATSLQTDSTLPKRRFETQLQVPAGTPYVAVTALDRNGKPLRRSKALRLA